MRADLVIDCNSKIKFYTITDVDIENIQESDLLKCKQYFYDNGLIVFKNQHANPDSFLTFAKKWGQVQQYTLKDYGSKKNPNILFINNNGSGEIKGARRIGTMWHSDSSFQAAPLPLTFLYAVQVPPLAGDTLFIDMRNIYNGLSIDMIKKLEQIDGVHEVTYAYRVVETDIDYSIIDIMRRVKSLFPPVKHPTIITHPVTKLKSIYINPGYTTKLVKKDIEFPELLTDIIEKTLNRDNIYAYKWTKNDLLVWDNRSVIHSATDIPQHLDRKMMRVGIEDLQMY
ncbi:MAG: tauD, taurine dioxygenase [Burkholderiales bacterium]|jgi:taurine dioxygenase|nr:tauD, taurine dioxygenase [Burkholderiales bacterium]